MSRWLSAAVAAVLLIGAWFVARGTPDGEERLSDPFPVAATVGTPAEGRNLGVTVHSLTLADRVTTGGWFAEGTWLVVDLDAWAVRTESPAALTDVWIEVGEVTYTASERPGFYDHDASLRRAGLFLAGARAGTVAFELPATITEERGILHLAMSDGTADSVIDLPVDFGALAYEAEIELPSLAWADPADGAAP
ncbi:MULTISPECIES: hypothetical protein [Microbacterium]|uniref:hypothetical protein n=1 Tax=Microbacterium TaxID=33882 RepID=UPI0019C9EDB1|nr:MULTISPECIES: hypothetical protein [Microbacterium]MBD3759034.1 hypothetical protein [Microbacterium sp.]